MSDEPEDTLLTFLAAAPVDDEPDETNAEVEEYWLPLLKTDGQWDGAKIRAELHDLVFVLNQVSEVYDHITGGKLSKQMYFASVIKAEHDDALSKAESEGAATQRALVAELAGALEEIRDAQCEDDDTCCMNTLARVLAAARAALGRVQKETAP